MQATALVCVLILLTCPFRRVRIFRGRLPCLVFLVIVMMQHLPYSIVTGFLSRILPNFGILRNPARLWNKFCCQNALCCSLFLLLRTSDVHQHLLRIIGCSILQNRVDDSQKLAGYDNQ